LAFADMMKPVSTFDAPRRLAGAFAYAFPNGSEMKQTGSTSFRSRDVPDTNKALEPTGVNVYL